MKKIIAQLFISLDGVIHNPHEWHFPYFSDAMGQAVDGVIGQADTLLLGRATYDGFAEAWPGRETEGGEDAYFAKKLGDTRKVVVSHRPLDGAWRNSERLEGDLVDAVTALKNEPGDGHIAVSGSVRLVRQLLAAGLLDDLNLLVHPIAVGKGDRLFRDGSDTVPLTLLSSTPLDLGVLDVHYGPAAPAEDASYEDAKQHLAGAES
ncbi:dihydrofolate reductase family protein [Streptomyces zhihengii]|uniref:dihydrofolate reductase family protein n=1 Tax=Streptomyces zhihengii TaxID=1818004 RepID=UPI0033B882E8